MSDNPEWRHLSGWRKSVLTGVFREEFTGGIAVMRPVRGYHHGEINT